MQAIFVKGEPLMVDYTPSGAVTAGDVVVVNGVTMIAHQDIAADALGSMAIGGGIYDMLATSGDTIALFDDVSWNDSSNIAEEATSGNTAIGLAVVAKASGETTVRVFHQYPFTAEA